MSDELDDEERELLRKYREKKARTKPGRKVTVRGKHDSGAEYSFDLDGDDAERVISRHRALWSDEDGPEGGEDGEGEDGTDGGEGEGSGGAEDGGSGGRGRAAGGAAGKATGRKQPYFKR